jgi:hypothetical protein
MKTSTTARNISNNAVAAIDIVLAHDFGILRHLGAGGTPLFVHEWRPFLH